MLFLDFICKQNPRFQAQPSHEVGTESFTVVGDSPIELEVLQNYVSTYLQDLGIKEDKMKILVDSIGVCGVGFLPEGKMISIYISYNPQDQRELKATVTAAA